MPANYDPLNNYGNIPVPVNQNNSASLPTGITNPTQQAIKSLATILPFIYPIGSIYTSAISTNPGDKTMFNFGKWVAFGQGKVLVGLDPNDADFSTGENVGGAKTHFHWQSSGADSATAFAEVDGAGSGHTSVVSVNRTTWSTTGTGVNPSRRDGTYDSSSMPPYIVVYMWQRLA